MVTIGPIDPDKVLFGLLVTIDAGARGAARPLDQVRAADGRPGCSAAGGGVHRHPPQRIELPPRPSGPVECRPPVEGARLIQWSYT
eukprot:3749522-Pyramimonas_sp.AAC.2